MADDIDDLLDEFDDLLDKSRSSIKTKQKPSGKNNSSSRKATRNEDKNLKRLTFSLPEFSPLFRIVFAVSFFMHWMVCIVFFSFLTLQTLYLLKFTGEKYWPRRITRYDPRGPRVYGRWTWHSWTKRQGKTNKYTYSECLNCKRKIKRMSVFPLWRSHTFYQIFVPTT